MSCSKLRAPAPTTLTAVHTPCGPRNGSSQEAPGSCPQARPAPCLLCSPSFQTRALFPKPPAHTPGSAELELRWYTLATYCEDQASQLTSSCAAPTSVPLGHVGCTAPSPSQGAGCPGRSPSAKGSWKKQVEATLPPGGVLRAPDRGPHDQTQNTTPPQVKPHRNP